MANGKKIEAIPANRDAFQSKWGFILACIGSAVGMGNIWMFPYRVGALGGFAFLIPYFIFVGLIGFIGVIGEMTLGRGTGQGPLGAYRIAMDAKGRGKLGEAIGLIPVIGQLGVGIGYSVVMGWVIRFLIGSATGSAISAPDSGAYFGAIAGPFGSVPWHITAIVVTFTIMAFGIADGIERCNKIMIPLFYALFIILAIRAATLPGAGEGYKYLLRPNWSALGDIRTWVFALGQAFFSLSIGGGGTVVYGSYLKKHADIIGSARNVAIFDTMAAMLAAIVIIPSVFAFNMDPAAGPPLMFITMPMVFKQMPFGQAFMIIFFAAVLFAGLTSLINLFESPVEALQSRFGFSRRKAVLSVAIAATGVSVFIEGLVGEWMDVVTIYIVPLGAICAALLLWWVLGERWARCEAQMGREKTIGKWFEPMGKYLFCGVTILVYILSIFYGGIG